MFEQICFCNIFNFLVLARRVYSISSGLFQPQKHLFMIIFVQKGLLSPFVIIFVQKGLLNPFVITEAIETSVHDYFWPEGPTQSVRDYFSHRNISS